MARVHAEAVIKNIIREIADQCASRGQAVTETLVAFIVKAAVLDPKNNLSTDRALTKNDVENLVKVCVERLMDVGAPSLQTIKMQVYFDMNYASRAEFLREHHRVLEQRMNPAVREITDSRPRTRDELEALYRKIVTAVLLRSGLGSPTELGVVRETAAALQSVFPQSEMATFLALHKHEKERQIIELALIVTGIRLFNRDCGRGGEGIDDLPAILNEAVPALSQMLEMALRTASDKAARYSAILERVDAFSQPSNQDEQPPEFTVDVCDLVKDCLYNIRQHYHFLTVILADLARCAEQVEALQSQLGRRLDQLRATVQQRTAVPTAQVYPQFVHLAQIWSSLQDEMVVLSVLSNLLSSLEQFTRCHERLPDDAISTLLGGAQILNDDQRNAEHGGVANRIAVVCPPPDQEWLYPDSMRDFDKLQFQLKGFCPQALGKKGILLRGHPEIGVLRWKNDQLFTFSSKAAALEFAVEPTMLFSGIIERARYNPELIQFLELHRHFTGRFMTTADELKRGAAGLKTDADVQTDTHILEPTIVRSYEWNEWELRRQALRLANMRKKATHSVQTVISQLRRDNISQVYLPKDQATQIKKDGSSMVPKPQTFQSGLRGFDHGGTDPAKFEKLDLTLDVRDGRYNEIKSTPQR